MEQNTSALVFFVQLDVLYIPPVWDGIFRTRNLFRKTYRLSVSGR